MKYGSVIFCLNLAYVIGLFCFLILFYFKIKIIFLTNSLIIASIILLIIKLFLWYLIGKDQDNTNIANKQKIFLYRLIKGLKYLVTMQSLQFAGACNKGKTDKKNSRWRNFLHLLF